MAQRMERTILNIQDRQDDVVLASSRLAPRQDVFFRALVELGNGGVAGIETARHLPARLEDRPHRLGAWAGVEAGGDALAAWGRELRHPAAYLLRGDPMAPDGMGAAPSVTPNRIIAMYDVERLLADPARSLDALLAAKRRGVRVLLDNFDMETPPVRFLEMLPADILRVALRRLPWHWDESVRLEAVASLVRFAENVLMDVAVADVGSRSCRQAVRRLGVRYAQGAWRRDTAGVVPEPGSLL